MKQLVPLNDRIVVKPIEQTEQMYGNIIIADMGKERPEMGEVIAVGPGRMSAELNLMEKSTILVKQKKSFVK